MPNRSNLSGRANFSYRDNVLPRFTSPTRRRNQVVAGELRAPGVLPGSRACSEACCETRAAGARYVTRHAHFYAYLRNNLETA